MQHQIGPSSSSTKLMPLIIIEGLRGHMEVLIELIL